MGSATTARGTREGPVESSENRMRTPDGSPGNTHAAAYTVAKTPTENAKAAKRPMLMISSTWRSGQWKPRVGGGSHAVANPLGRGHKSLCHDPGGARSPP